jgi:DNA-binding transcriptional MerR regulator
MVDKLCLSEDIRIGDIPDMELYMDQVLTFLNGKLEKFKRENDDKILTKTMINNYTKDQLLIPPKNKKYSREHILLLILIYHLKNVLSINDIKHLFKPILKDITTPDDDVIPLADIYATYLTLKQEELANFSDSFAEKITKLTDKTAPIVSEQNRKTAELFLTVLMLIAQASVSKRLAEKIIDAYFTDNAD